MQVDANREPDESHVAVAFCTVNANVGHEANATSIANESINEHLSIKLRMIAMISVFFFAYFFHPKNRKTDWQILVTNPLRFAFVDAVSA